MEEDLSKWTQVLDRALDLPDVDWLIRSETAPDEAFDIEVTGGWVKFLCFILVGSVIHKSRRNAAPQLRYLILQVSPSRTILTQSYLPTRMPSLLPKSRQALCRWLTPP